MELDVDGISQMVHELLARYGAVNAIYNLREYEPGTVGVLVEYLNTRDAIKAATSLNGYKVDVSDTSSLSETC
jgi:hypothetical protein